jgi:phosphate transport system permease protein
MNRLRAPAPLASWSRPAKQARPPILGSRHLGDRVFDGVLRALGLVVLALPALMLVELFIEALPRSRPSASASSRARSWDPGAREFGAFPFIYGTVVTSLLALLLAVPVSLGVAIFLSDLAPRVLQKPLGFLVELLAAIPSVVYGFWGIFVLVPSCVRP